MSEEPSRRPKRSPRPGERKLRVEFYLDPAELEAIERMVEEEKLASRNAAVSKLIDLRGAAKGRPGPPRRFPAGVAKDYDGWVVCGYRLEPELVEFSRHKTRKEAEAAAARLNAAGE